MDDKLNSPTKMSEAEWLAEALKSVGNTPFFMANRSIYPAGNVQIPAELVRRLPYGFEGPAALVITTIAAIDELGLPFGIQRHAFLNGEVVMVAQRYVAQLHERPHGGQRVRAAGLEQRARDGLRIVVVLACEINRACLDREENTKRDPQYRRIGITLEMEPLLGGLRGMSCFREGQNLLPVWFPGLKAYRVMKWAYQEIADMPRITSQTYFARVRMNQMKLVRTAGLIYAKVLSYEGAQHAMSAEMRAMEGRSAGMSNSTEKLKKQQISASVLQELAHAKHDSPTIDDLMEAAIVMDINPVIIFSNVASFATELACAQLLGRVMRGIGVSLEPMHCQALAAFIERADSADLEPEHVNETDRAAQRLRDLALKVKSRSGWNNFCVIAKVANTASWLPPAPRSGELLHS